jgi:hypothetical protein
MRRGLITVAVLGAVVFGLAVFLPWAGVTGGSVQVAGWGSGGTPRLRGMLVITCAAVALACLASPPLAGEGRTARLSVVAAAVAASVALVATLSVLTGLAAFVGTPRSAVAAFGLLAAVVAEVVTVLAAVAVVAVWPSATPEDRPPS